MRTEGHTKRSQEKYEENKIPQNIRYLLDTVCGSQPNCYTHDDVFL